jgi:serine/threonine protein kinase/regulator of sirC expression with transglutaminase-like and TPR domain
MSLPSASALDLARAFAALRKGWIDLFQLRSARAAAQASSGSIVDRLGRDGALDAGKLAALLGSNVLLPRVAAPAAAEPAPLGSLPVGSLIGSHFQVLDARQGGFGQVYICEALGEERYARGNQRAALKTLLPERLRDPANRAAFQAEAAHWISLGTHPNLVHAYGIAEYQRLPFVVMEFIEGARTLHDEIVAGRVDWPRALVLGLGVARALAHAQTVAGLVHGDIKPLNILITPAGAAKLTDFGMAVCAEKCAAAEAPDTIAGTPGFFAPEMFAGRSARTTASDVYAFGVTLFLAVTGTYPFSPDQLGANLRAPPPDPRSRTPQLPAAFASFIVTCLDREPGRRPHSFAAIAERLERLHRELLSMPPPRHAPPDVPERAHALVNAAQSWLNLGEARQARATARDALALDRENWKAHLVLGHVHFEEGDHSAALASFGAAHEFNARAIEPMANAALACHHLGRRDEATRWLRLALQQCTVEDRFAPLDSVSLLFIELLPEKDAYNLIHRILTENPHSAITWNNRAALMRRMGSPADALESTDRALALNPVYAKAWINRANALVELHRFADGLASADRALELDPTVAGAYAARATALAQLGRLPDARACIARGLRQLPGHPLLVRAQDVFAR